MKSYYYSLNYFILLLGSVGSGSSLYFTASAIFESFSVRSFNDWMMIIFSVLAILFFAVFFCLLVGKIFNINQKIILKKECLEFPNYFFFMKPRIIQYSDIISSDLVTTQRGYLVDRNIKLVLKSKTMLILGKSLGNSEEDIIDLQNEILSRKENHKHVNSSTLD